MLCNPLNSYNVIMGNNNSDIFEAYNFSEEQHKSSQPLFLQQKQNTQGTNFFLFDSAPVLKNVNEPARRINDFDSNLLNENAYKDVDDDTFRLEYKMSRAENEINGLKAQIAAAKDIHDDNLAVTLTNRLIAVKDNYENLLDTYRERSLSARISGNLVNIFGNKLKLYITKIKNKYSNILEFLGKNLPKKLSKLLQIKQSLDSLENINKSVDKLINMNTPYGENFDKYKQLSKYIVKANSIQSDISKQIRK